MRLGELLGALPAPNAPRSQRPGAAGADPIIRGLTYDSRDVSPGDAFFALRGAEVDGHDYLAAAQRLGASALIVESLPAGFEVKDAAIVEVPDSRRALAPIAAHFFGRPSEELSLIGVTGTNGKTSTTYLVESLLAAAGRRAGLIGTVEVRFGSERQRAVNTTPESLDLQRLLRNMCTQHVETAVMEVSSHGLDCGRVDGCGFAVAAFTNLTQDHLDHHGDMDRYREAKLLLMREHLRPDGVAIVNIDDPSGAAFVAAARERGARVLRVSREGDGDAEIRLLEAHVDLEGTRATVATPAASGELQLPLLGDFNLENLLVAVGIGVGLELPFATIAEGVAACPQVPGRIERVGASAGPQVIVDYAHTPDAVDKLLATLRPLCRGRLITVFGCGGDRDRAKRPLMAEAVARHADRVVATSDNPRTEDPERILDDVEAGLVGFPRVDAAAFDDTRGYLRIADRREAIRAALAIAGPDDMVAIAGKGHEDYQIIGRERLPFSDRDEALRALAEPTAPEAE
ncbi:MAG: UDP-N-acetylmuramoyl-L-alanyl-D-glutamate--2,6-diaminopimelate ligase [Myxococcota bacterium]